MRQVTGKTKKLVLSGAQNRREELHEKLHAYIFGMLGGLILMGILVSLMQVVPVMILHGLIQMTSNGYRAWLNRKDINWKIVGTRDSFVTLLTL